MEERVGERFQSETAIDRMGVPDQKRGVPMPPLEQALFEGHEIDLPKPSEEWGNASLGTVLRSRRSVREYSPQPLSLDELAGLLWATQGVDRILQNKATFRTAPSAGARHALETLLVVNRVESLPPGLYQYLALGHQLLAATERAVTSKDLAAACLGQTMIEDAAVTFAWVAMRDRMTWRYGERGYRYLHLDAGHVCQNLYLACEAIGAGACAIAAYDDAAANALFGLDGRERFVIYLASLGKRTVLA